MSSSDTPAKEPPTGEFQATATGVAQYVSNTLQNVKDAVVGEEPAVGDEASADAARHMTVPSPAEGAQPWTASVKNAIEAVGSKVLPEAHAVERRSGEKWGEAKSDAKEGAGKLSDAAGEAADAAGLKARQGLGKAEQGLDDAKYQAKGGWEEAKNVAGSAKDSVVEGAKDAKDSAVETAQDAKNRIADNAQAAKDRAVEAKDRAAENAQDAKNRVADNAQDAKNRAASTAHDATDRAARGVHETLPAEGTYATSEQGAGRAQGGGLFDSISNAVKSVTGRFTAPVSGDEDTDRAVIDRAAGKTRSAADTASAKAEEAKDSAKGAFSRDTRGKAQDAKEEAKQASSDAVESVKRAGQDAKEGTKNAVQGAKESVTDAAHDAKNAVTDTVESVEDYLTADLSPHTTEEAALQSGHIPSNTADVLASSHADAPSDSPTDIRDTEQAQGMNIMADKLAHAVDVGYGEENLGADDAAEIREAADGAGFHASYKK